MKYFDYIYAGAMTVLISIAALLLFHTIPIGYFIASCVIGLSLLLYGVFS